MIFLGRDRYNAADMAGRPPTKEAPIFGQRLAAIRKERGLSQQRLAEMLGTTRANIAYYERSATNPTMDFVQRCAEVLDATVAHLIGEPGEMPRKKRGPTSRADQLTERLGRLPRRKQTLILDMIEGAIEKAS